MKKKIKLEVEMKRFPQGHKVQLESKWVQSSLCCLQSPGLALMLELLALGAVSPSMTVRVYSLSLFRNKFCAWGPFFFFFFNLSNVSLLDINCDWMIWCRIVSSENVASINCSMKYFHFLQQISSVSLVPGGKKFFISMNITTSSNCML